MSVVAPILLLRGVPVHMPDVTIKIECNGGHGVAEIIRSERGPPGDVFVAFEELRWASQQPVMRCNLLEAGIPVGCYLSCSY